jgi:hypothetical protein
MDMETEALKPKLREAQKALEMALEKASGVDVTEVDTGELIRIEETLVMASKAAKEAVSMRLRLRSQRSRPKSGAEAAPPEVADTPAITHRIFDDIRGKRWRVFAVRASTATVELGALPEAFRHGWLVFDSSNEVRRVAPIPEHWEELSIEELRLLCHKAASTPRRHFAVEKRRTPEPPISS